jgi:uncharacterized delta-60 repeat protein
LAVALVVAVAPADGSLGVLDPSFGAATGLVTTSIGTSAGADAVVLQPDGKIVAAGAVVQTDSSQDFALVRYHPGGSLDTTFGTGGVVQAPTGAARGVAVQSDGKIVAVGTTFTQLRAARYNSDGLLDGSFGSGGVVTTSIGSGAADARAVVLQPDGKIVAGGQSSNASETVFTLVRYDTDGSLDPTFGSGGVVTTQVGTGDSSIQGLALQPDGKIVADGDAMEGPGVVRYDADGSLDPSFGSGGIVTAPAFTGQSVGVGPLVLQPDGKIVITVGFGVVRYETNGTVDPSFAHGGAIPVSRDHASGIALQPDGKIVVAGAARSGSTDVANLLELARFNTNGLLDGTFSNGGITFFDAWTGATGNPPPPQRPAIALQPDGKIVAAASQSDDAGIIQRFLLARFGASALTVNLINTAGPDKGAGGDISSNPAGIDCSVDFGCLYPPNFFWQHAFAAGTVTLTATPWEGYLFAGWSGGGCSGTGTCQVQMSGGVSGDRSVTATFTLAPTKKLTVTKTGTGAGRIASLPHFGPGGIFCRRRCSSTFVAGIDVSLQATPTSRWSRFAGWSDACSGKKTCTVTMTSDRSVTATFQHFCVAPRLKGKTVRAARRRARTAHCSRPKVRRVFSSKVRKGRVVGQKPAPGRHLLGRSRLRLTISKGKRAG